MPAVVLTILTTTKPKKGSCWGGGKCLLGFCCVPGTVLGAWWVLPGASPTHCCDPHFADKENKAWRAWALPAPAPVRNQAAGQRVEYKVVCLPAWAAGCTASPAGGDDSSTCSEPSISQVICAREKNWEAAWSLHVHSLTDQGGCRKSGLTCLLQCYPQISLIWIL